MGNKFLLIAIVLAVLMVGGAIMLAGKQATPTGETAAKAPPVQFNGEQALPDESFQTCAPGDSCIVVDTHCGFCCKYIAINARNEQAFNQGFDKSCRKYTGSSCQCFDLSSYPSCVEGKCQLVPWPDQKAKAPPRTEQPSESLPAPAPVAEPPAPAPVPAPAALPPATMPEEPAVSAEPVVPEEPEIPQETAPAPSVMEEPVFEEPGFSEPGFDQPAEAPPEEDLYAPLPDTMPTMPRRQSSDPLNEPLPSGQ